MTNCTEAINHFAKEESTFKTIAQKMPVIQEAIKILKIPFEVTKSLQKSDCTLSDFYGMCIAMREKLKINVNKQNNKTNLAKCLLNGFEKRRSKMIRNEAMLACVYLDRRFSADLEEREIELAKMTLCNLWEKVRNSKAARSNTAPQREVETPNDEDEEDGFDMAKYFQSKGLFTAGTFESQNGQASVPTTEQSSAENKPNYNKSKSEFLILLDEFEQKYQFIDHKTSILKFWEEQKENFPEIHVIANILLGIPPSQAAIERAFSQFGFVYECHRTQLSPDLLEAILLIKLNKDLAHSVFNDDQTKLKHDFDLMENEN